MGAYSVSQRPNGKAYAVHTEEPNKRAPVRLLGVPAGYGTFHVHLISALRAYTVKYGR